MGTRREKGLLTKHFGISFHFHVRIYLLSKGRRSLFWATQLLRIIQYCCETCAHISRMIEEFFSDFFIMNNDVVKNINIINKLKN